MYKVKVQNACSCFIKSGIAELLEFSTQEEAKKEAQNLLQKMQNDFCKRHDFLLSEKFGDYTLFIQTKTKEKFL